MTLIDLFPAQLTIDGDPDPNHPGYNKVRLYVLDDGRAWIILEDGQVAREFEGAVTDGHPLQGTVTAGPITLHFQPGRGCGCSGSASAITAMDLANA